MNPVMLDKVDEFIVGILNKSAKPLTVYQIAKEAGLSWATVNIHCYKLKSNGVVNDNIYECGPGQKKTLWCVPEKT